MNSGTTLKISLCHPMMVLNITQDKTDKRIFIYHHSIKSVKQKKDPQQKEEEERKQLGNILHGMVLW